MLMKLVLTLWPSGNCAGGLPQLLPGLSTAPPLWVAPHTLLVVLQNSSKHTCGLQARPRLMDKG